MTAPEPLRTWTVYTSEETLRRYHVEAPTGEEAQAIVATAIRERRENPAVAWEGLTEEQVLDFDEGVR